MLSNGERDFKKLKEPLEKYELYPKLDEDFIKNVIEIAKKEIESVTDLKFFIIATRRTIKSFFIFKINV